MNLNKPFWFVCLCLPVLTASKALAAPKSNTSDLSWLLMQLKKNTILEADHQQLQRVGIVVDVPGQSSLNPYHKSSLKKSADMNNFNNQHQTFKLPAMSKAAAYHSLKHSMAFQILAGKNEMQAYAQRISGLPASVEIVQQSQLASANWFFQNSQLSNYIITFTRPRVDGAAL